MANSKEIIRLHERGSTQREIAQIEHCSLATVSKTLRAARLRQLGYAELAKSDDATVRQLLFNPQERVSSYYQPDFSCIDDELRVSGVNLALLWDEYTRACEAASMRGYKYSQFCNLYREWKRLHGKSASATMRVKHAPGRLMEVDWCGDRSSYIEASSGEVVEPYVFVACLPYSQRVYAEAFDTLAQDSWTAAHVHAFAYNQGASELITPDNCKTGVVKADYYDPVVNRDYAELAAHYGAAILPARPYRPKDKGSTENSVKLVETWVIAYLRKDRFFSLEELNAAIRKRVDELNAQNFQRLDYSRNDIFDSEERSRLTPLPERPFERSEWHKSKVGADYCVQIERQRYSVPYRLIGQRLDVRTTKGTVEVFKDAERVASHCRLYGRFNQCSVKEEHMPDAHKLYSEEWSPERFKEWAASVGPSCLLVIEALLASKPHPALAYRSCMGVLGLARSKGNTSLEEICKRARATSKNPSYGQIKRLAKGSGGKERKAGAGDAGGGTGIGGAGMVRGADYYRLD